jgi:copper transport protein
MVYSKAKKGGRGMNKRHLKRFVLLGLLLFFLFPQSVSAHASLVQANPAANSELAKAPLQIVLTFNERLDDSLFSLDVFNSQGKEVTENKPSMGKKQRKLRIELPSLDDGLYTVSYQVISADGHPVQDSYVFIVGDTTSAENGRTGITDNLHEGHNDMSSSLIRIFYYFGLLFLTGWTVWGIVLRQKKSEFKREYNVVSGYLLKIYLLMLVAVGIVQFTPIIYRFGFGEAITLFTETSIGVCWLLSLVLAVSAFGFLHRSRSFDGIWVALLLVLEGINGHALGFSPALLTVTFNTIHLMAAAIWSGGLLYLFIFWKKHPQHIKQFLLLFSKAAFISIIILIVTGTLNTLLFIPDISYLTETAWGIFLIVKTVLVVGVVITGVLIRLQIKKTQSDELKSRLKLDFGLMVLIIGIVGIFTYLSPLPVNEPVVWSESENSIEMTAEIAPFVPGKNKVIVKVNAPEKPQQVQLSLIYEDDKDVSPIDTTLEPAGNGEGKKFYRYVTEKGYIPFPGDWKVEVRILGKGNRENVFQKELTSYPIKD